MKSVNELKAPLSAIFTPLIGEFRIKTYFSYYGIFKDKIMLALYKDEQLYLRIAKTDLEEIKLVPNTLLLEDPNVGLQLNASIRYHQHFGKALISHNG